MTRQEGKKGTYQRYLYRILAVCFWLLLWEIISIRVGYEILLPSPGAVLVTLLELTGSIDFWQTILFSSFRIIFGFLLALFVGIILAIGAYCSRLIKELIAPLLKTIQAMPVASFIILALIWVHPKNLSALTSFLMVMPLIYSNVLRGLMVTDDKLLQMAKIFQIHNFEKIIAIYIPSVRPYFISAISVGVGFSWKAGIAAEVIGFVTGSSSIGKQLYEAKLYLMTKELFAWTFVIIIISILFEKAVLLLLQPMQKNAKVQDRVDSLAK